MTSLELHVSFFEEFLLHVFVQSFNFFELLCYLPFVELDFALHFLDLFVELNFALVVASDRRDVVVVLSDPAVDFGYLPRDPFINFALRVNFLHQGHCSITLQLQLILFEQLVIVCKQLHFLENKGVGAESTVVRICLLNWVVVQLIHHEVLPVLQILHDLQKAFSAEGEPHGTQVLVVNRSWLTNVAYL